MGAKKKAKKPLREALQDIQNPFWWLNVHNQDWWQKTHAPFVEQQSYPHFYWYQLVNGSQFQPKGVEVDKNALQESSTDKGHRERERSNWSKMNEEKNKHIRKTNTIKVWPVENKYNKCEISKTPNNAQTVFQAMQIKIFFHE